MFKRYNKITLRCLAIIPIIFILDLFGVFTHLFEEDFERHFQYPLIAYKNQHEMPTAVPSNEAFNYQFKILPKLPITDDTPRLTLLVKSSTGNLAQRATIRQTWGYENRFSDVHIRRVFLLGLPKNGDESAAIATEASQNNDIVQGDFLDTYFNNTIKTMIGIRWASEHFNSSDYYMFVDDDYYVSIKNVLRFLGGDSGRRQRHVATSNLLFAGFVFQTAPLRHKFSKWYVSLAEYPFDKWPPYVTAGAFVLSHEALLQLHGVSRHVPLFRFDDIYLGIVALKAGIKVQHCENFYFNRPRYNGPDSYGNVIASHGFDDPKEMAHIWNACRSANYA